MIINKLTVSMDVLVESVKIVFRIAMAKIVGPMDVEVVVVLVTIYRPVCRMASANASLCCAMVSVAMNWKYVIKGSVVNPTAQVRSVDRINVEAFVENVSAMTNVLKEFVNLSFHKAVI